MNKHAVLLSVLLLSCGPAFAATGADSVPVAGMPASSAPRFSAPRHVPVPLREESFYDVWIRDRLSIGIGVSVATLTKNHRPQDRDAHRTFVGYVNKLENDHPVRMTADLSYWASRHLRFGLTLDRAGARTRNYNNHRSDGVLDVWGPALYGEIVLPCLDDTLLPHFGGGVVYGFSDFEEDTWWHLGYTNPAEYDATGHTIKTKNDKYREIRVDDAFGFLLQAGIAWRPIEHMQIDLTLRQTFLSCDAEFGYRGNHGFRRELTGEFDVDNFAVVTTLSYVF